MPKCLGTEASWGRSVRKATLPLVHVVDAVLHYTLGFAKLQCIPKKTVVYYDYTPMRRGRCALDGVLAGLQHKSMFVSAITSSRPRRLRCKLHDITVKVITLHKKTHLNPLHHTTSYVETPAMTTPKG